MRDWPPARVAAAAGALLAGGEAPRDAPPGPLGAPVDSRTLTAGELFVGVRGERTDGGEHAAQALAAGAWGVLVEPEHALSTLAQGVSGVVLEHAQPLRGLQALARSWRAQLGEEGARVVAITGSTGKTSTKDILAALLGAQLRVVASPENLNTEIGMPLAVLAAPAGTELLVLEMAMRGAGQIAELAAIARPDVGLIVNVGPVHLELLGSLEAIAAAKAELIEALAPGAFAVIPAGEALLEAHLRADVHTITFGAGGDVELARAARARVGDAQPQPPGGEVAIRVGARARRGHAGEAILTLRPSFSQAYNVDNLLAAVAAASALGFSPEGELRVSFSALRGERVALPGGVLLINDCYNANPMSMRAAIEDLAATAPGRRVAVLGDMLELGDAAREFHRAIGEHAAHMGIELLVTVGPLAAEMGAGYGRPVRAVPDARAAAQALPALLREGDTVLVKGSRGVGLELVAEALRGWADSPSALAAPRSR